MVKNLQTDDAFIRMPDKLDSSSQQPAPGDVFPIHAGNHWTMHYTTATGRVVTENILDSGPTTVNGLSGEKLHVQDDNRKPAREEVYGVDGQGVSLMASGSATEMMQMSPPIPLFHLPIKPGDQIVWDGLLRLKGTTSPATALSRSSGGNLVKLDDKSTLKNKTVRAYRIDTIVTTTIGGQTAAFPMTRWLAPGIGMVQERVLVGRDPVLKQLTSYVVTGKN